MSLFKERIKNSITALLSEKSNIDFSSDNQTIEEINHALGITIFKSTKFDNKVKNPNMPQMSYISNGNNVVGINLKKSNINEDSFINIIPLLNKLKHLNYLNLCNNKFNSITFLRNLKVPLLAIDVSYNNLSSIDVLGNIKTLKLIDASFNVIKDISNITGLKQLRTLILNNNNIKDAKPLGFIPTLVNLNLAHNRITDISTFNNLINLKTLAVEYNRINDLSVIKFLRNKKLEDGATVHKNPNTMHYTDYTVEQFDFIYEEINSYLF